MTSGEAQQRTTRPEGRETVETPDQDRRQAEAGEQQEPEGRARGSHAKPDYAPRHS